MNKKLISLATAALVSYAVSNPALFANISRKAEKAAEIAKQIWIPPRHDRNYRKLQDMKMHPDLITALKSNNARESGNQQFEEIYKKVNGQVRKILRCKASSDNAVGITQLTPIGIEETVWRNLSYEHRNNLTPEEHYAQVNSDALIDKYLNALPITRKKDLHNYLTNRKARKRVVNYLVDLITKNPDANFAFGTSCYLYYRAEMKNYCQKIGVPYEMAMTPAAYNNGPGDMRQLIGKYKRKWRKHLPKETAAHIRWVESYYAAIKAANKLRS